MLKICECCGKEFETSKKAQKYCSIKCMGIAKRKNIPIQYCEVCGKIIKPNYRHGNKKRKYCSQECYHKSKHKTNEITIQEDYAIVHINSKHKGKLECYIDIEDINKIKDYCWNVDKDNYAKSGKIRMHKLIHPVETGFLVDHINRNTLDNRKENLRTVNYEGNAYNRSLSSKNKSGYTGICYKKSRKKWEVYFGRKYLGAFTDKEDAIKCRKEQEKLYKFI